MVVVMVHVDVAVGVQVVVLVTVAVGVATVIVAPANGTPVNSTAVPEACPVPEAPVTFNP